MIDSYFRLDVGRCEWLVDEVFVDLPYFLEFEVALHILLELVQILHQFTALLQVILVVV